MKHIKRSLLLLCILALFVESANADRWWCVSLNPMPGHAYVVIETYDEDGKVNGYMQLHNSPGWTSGEDDYTVAWYGIDEPMPWGTSRPLIFIKYVSTQGQDEMLRYAWCNLDSDPNVHSWGNFSCCYTAPHALMKYPEFVGPPIRLDPGDRTIDDDNPPIRGMDDPVQNPHGYGLPK